MITVQRTNDDPDKPKAEITFDNGDLKAFDGVIEGWRFKDELSMLRFMVAVMGEAKDHVIYVQGANGKQQAFAPADILLKQTEVTESNDGTESKPTNKASK